MPTAGSFGRTQVRRQNCRDLAFPAQSWRGRRASDPMKRRVDPCRPSEETSMKHLVLLAAAAAAFLATPSAEAAGRSNRSGASAASTRQGPIARLAELERAKNAWLRQVFLRR
jgi:hypothetical protein